MAMIGRFIQLFLLASMVLLIPSLFYLSRQQQPYNVAKDFALMQTQKTQGNGAPPAIEPQLAQAWKWKKPWAEGWGQIGAKMGELAGSAKIAPEKGPEKSNDVKVEGAIMPKMENATAK